ncbi:hypothetical protein ACFYO0_42825 [Streptomyces sp. NPDC006365]
MTTLAGVPARPDRVNYSNDALGTDRYPPLRLAVGGTEPSDSEDLS